MNKQTLIKTIASKIDGATQKDVALIIDTFAETVKETVATDEKVSIAGFITFEKKHIEAKSGTIQLGEKKGETWTTEPKDVVSVKLSKSYKEI